MAAASRPGRRTTICTEGKNYTLICVIVHEYPWWAWHRREEAIFAEGMSAEQQRQHRIQQNKRAKNTGHNKALDGSS